MLAQHGLKDRWTWLGRCKDISALHESHDVLVHPSVREGLPNSICEALSSGLPVIAGRGADHELLLGAAGERGLLFQPSNPDDLARALARFAGLDAAERASIGARGRAFAEQELALDRCVARYEALIQELTRARAH